MTLEPGCYNLRIPSLTKIYDKWMWKLEDPEAFSRAFKYNLKLKKWGLTIDWKGTCFQIHDSAGKNIYILSKHRLEKYKNGIDARLNQLASEYMLQKVDFDAGSAVIDCGANVGEIGIFLAENFSHLNYIAFEPGRPEFEVCKLNNPGKHCVNAALWFEDTELELFNKSNTADSSVIAFKGFEETTRVAAISLDTFCERENIDRIALLKLEAEGAEPEILHGARRTLSKTRYISVDCGFERGENKESTLPDVSNFLIQNNFEMQSVYSGNRLVVLFKSSKPG